MQGGVPGKVIFSFILQQSNASALQNAYVLSHDESYFGGSVRLVKKPLKRVLKAAFSCHPALGVSMAAA